MAYFKNEEVFKESCGYDVNGIWYPRVTKIIDIKSKPALYKFYGDSSSYESAVKMTENSAEEGTLIHETVEKILLGENVEVPEKIKPSIDAFIDLLEKTDILTEKGMTERRIAHPIYKYAGTIDAMASINGRLGVLDVKTSQSIYRDYNLQTSAYMEALISEVPTLETRWILRIDQTKKCFRCGATLRPKGGRNKIRKGIEPLCINDDHEWSDLTGVAELQEFPFWKTDFQAFLAAKKLWEWENSYWLRKIGYYK
ncbi:hypothetical protein KJ671_01930 [Patescibacteria group bacterium]|nr:hypothetical protein [Patescibacteria group bacterium]